MTQHALIGHNNPPSDLEILRDRLKENNQKVFDQVDKLKEAADRVPQNIEDDETAGKVADYIKAVNTCNKALEDTRKAEKQPFLDMGRAVDDTFKRPQEELAIAKAKANKPLTAYSLKKQEEERKRREAEAEKARQEAEERRKKEEELRQAGLEEQAQAAAKQAEKEEKKADRYDQSIESGSGLGMSKGATASVSVRKIWVGKIVDRDKLDLEALRPYFSEADLQKAVNGFVREHKGDKKLAGASITEEASAVTR